jgi:nitrogen fixation protein NifQ
MQAQSIIKQSIKGASTNATRLQAFHTETPFDSVSDRHKSGQIYQSLRRHARNPSPNTEWLARMLSSWRAGHGALPDYLGLQCDEFQAMQTRFFGQVSLPGISPLDRKPDFSRMLEREDLMRLILQYSAYPNKQETTWIANILIAGCLGNDHLWQDLGLWNRNDLSGLIRYNFPGLATKNTRDMKWKKFIYKQLCEAEGVYLCRAPSCDVCIDREGCFGPEE